MLKILPFCSKTIIFVQNPTILDYQGLPHKAATATEEAAKSIINQQNSNKTPPKIHQIPIIFHKVPQTTTTNHYKRDRTSSNHTVCTVLPAGSSKYLPKVQICPTQPTHSAHPPGHGVIMRTHTLHQCGDPTPTQHTHTHTHTHTHMHIAHTHYISYNAVL